MNIILKELLERFLPELIEAVIECIEAYLEDKKKKDDLKD